MPANFSTSFSWPATGLCEGGNLVSSLAGYERRVKKPTHKSSHYCATRAGSRCEGRS
jgi:hypothetical protein